MKKILLGLITLSTFTMATDGTKFYLKTGLDISGKFDTVKLENVAANKSENDKLGIDLTAEFTKNFSQNLELGFGLSYQDHGQPESINFSYYKVQNTGYKSLPVYALAKYNIPLESNIKPYLKADLGYSFNFGEKDLKIEAEDNLKSSVDNGLYYGLGAGIEYNNFIVELMYKVNKADIHYRADSNKTPSFNYDYSRTTLSFGYKFDIQ